MTAARKTMPTGKTLLQGCIYVPAAQTDIRVTFARIAAEAAAKTATKPLELVRARRLRGGV